jgi:allantoin racemase
VLDYDHPEKVRDQALRVAKLMVNQDKIEALILGCGSLFDIQERLEESLSLPVVAPGEVALKHAEILVDLGLSHSKKSFMIPLPVKIH